MLNWLPFLSIILIWIVGLCIHEWAHARVAYAGGDTTVEEKGYLDLNPLRYIDPLGSIIIPVIVLIIGGIPLPGGAVWIETHRIRSRGWLSAMSAAGPLGNIAVALVLGLLFKLRLIETDTIVAAVVAVSCFLQLFSAFLNLLPVPGLDGFGVLIPWLPRSAQEFSRRSGRFLPFIVLIISMQNPGFARAFWKFADPILRALEVPHRSLIAGWDILRALSSS